MPTNPSGPTPARFSVGREELAVVADSVRSSSFPPGRKGQGYIMRIAMAFVRCPMSRRLEQMEMQAARLAIASTVLFAMLAVPLQAGQPLKAPAQRLPSGLQVSC